MLDRQGNRPLVCFDSFRLMQRLWLARIFHPGQTVLSQTWPQPSLGKLPQDETLRLKGPVLTQGSGWVSGQKGLCGWRKGQKWWGGGGKESAGIPGKREFKLYRGCV